MAEIQVPDGLDAVLDEAWEAARNVPGYLLESEARLLGTIAACTAADGVIVETGSFKGKSTIMLAKVAAHYGLGSVVAIDPHNSPILLDHRVDPEATSFRDFERNLEAAGVADNVEVHCAYSEEVLKDWNRLIRLLWIDGDHTYPGAKIDFDGFFPYLSPLGVVALHDSLHEFSGPIRVFVEEILRSSHFGAAGFVGSTAWSQFRPEDGDQFRELRAQLERFAAPIVPLVQSDMPLRGLRKLRFKVSRWRVPRSPLRPNEWVSQVNGEVQG